jgi:hypothetical protein
MGMNSDKDRGKVIDTNGHGIGKLLLRIRIGTRAPEVLYGVCTDDISRCMFLQRYILVAPFTD